MLGGYGSVGTWIVRMLRRLHPDLAFVIAGRDLEKAADFAGALGNASASGWTARVIVVMPSDSSMSSAFRHPAQERSGSTSPNPSPPAAGVASRHRMR
jgi:prephenate dehydrogenase